MLFHLKHREPAKQGKSPLPLQENKKHRRSACVFVAESKTTEELNMISLVITSKNKLGIPILRWKR